MRVSWKWLADLVDLSGFKSPEALGDFLTSRGLEVEELHRQDAGFESVVTVRILEKKPHPQADRLSLCKVSQGEGEPVDIVCGAQNMKVGDIVALAQVGASLPNGMKISQGKIRGEVSNGMLCSESELGLSKESDGILILPEGTKLGQPLAMLLGRDDSIFSLKLTANRGDCLGHWGIAREIAGALGKPLKRPPVTELDWKGTRVSIGLNAGESAPQFYGCVIEGVKVGPSPAWVVRRLEAVGSRSINTVVDATNLAMLEFGHPMHAYDLDLLEGSRIGVRQARSGEAVALLDGSSVQCDGTELVVEDGARAVGLAGVMGGGNSEVRSGTNRLFLECAEFAPGVIRRTATKHQRRTEASHRFERGIDPRGLPVALGRLTSLILELAGGSVVESEAAFLPSRDPKAASSRKIGFAPGYINEYLGTDLTESEIVSALEAQGCELQKSPAEWTVIPPSYRLDLSIREDLTEEVARHVGYDRIPSTIPQLTSEPRPMAWDAKFSKIMILDRAKDALVQQGLSEVVNLGFANSAWLSQFGFENPLKVMNPLSEETDSMVPSLIPGLVRNALDNWRHHFGSESLAIRLFEIRPTFHADGPLSAQGEMQTNAQERWKLSIAMSGPKYAGGLRNELGQVDFYDLEAAIEGMFEFLGTKGVRFIPFSQSRTQGSPLFHPGQSVEVLAGNQVAGHFGQLHPAQARALKTRDTLWIAELDWEAILKLSRPAQESRGFKPVPQFPPMERDFALVVKDDVSSDKITQLALKAGKPLAKSAKIFDIYRGKPVPEGMTSVAVRVIFFDEGRSLQESETEAACQQILEVWKKELGAQLR